MSDRQINELSEVYKPEFLAKMKKNYRGKYPHNIHTTSSNGKGTLDVVTNNGNKYTVTARETGGRMPKIGTHINQWKPGAVSEEADMTDDLAAFLEAAASGEYVEANGLFEDILREKISARIDDLRIGVADAVFNESVDPDEIDEDDVDDDFDWSDLDDEDIETLADMTDEELDEGVIKPYHALHNSPFSKDVEQVKNTAGAWHKLAQGSKNGKEFEVHHRYNGSMKRDPHVVVDKANDRVIGSGLSMPAALRDAGINKKHVTHYSKFSPGSHLNTFKEDAEYLDEISRRTLASYTHRALNDVRNSNMALARGADGEHQKKAHNREAGIRLATDKLFGKTVHDYHKNTGPSKSYTMAGKQKDAYLKRFKKQGAVLSREEVENLDELSNATLISYINKARPSLADYRYKREYAKHSGDPKYFGLARKAGNRKRGINLAKAKYK